MGDGVSEKDSLRRGRSRSQSFEGKSRSRSASVEKDFDPLKTELTRDEFVAYVENPRKQPARGISYTEALAAPPEVATPVREALDNPELRAKVGAAGRERVKSQWSWRHTAIKTVDQYRAVLDEHAARVNGAG